MTATVTVNSRRSLAQLRQHFSQQLQGWGLDRSKCTVLASVQTNWLSGEAGMDIANFRQANRKRQEDIDWLTSRSFLGSSGAHYELNFLSFCILLAIGNRTSRKLKSIMEGILKLTATFLAEKPIFLHRPLDMVRLKLGLQDDNHLLLPALKLMHDGNMGVYFNPGGQDQFAFTDTIHRNRGVTATVWRALEGYPFSPTSAAIQRSVSAPIELLRLQLVQDAYANANKAIERMNSHPESAVTAARAALEATFKHILGDGHPAMNQPFTRQVAACKAQLQLDTEFLALGRGLVSTATAVSEVRNTYGDSHGKSTQDRSPTRAEARLAVGSALLVCDFLLDRHEVCKSIPQRASSAT